MVGKARKKSGEDGETDYLCTAHYCRGAVRFREFQSQRRERKGERGEGDRRESWFSVGQKRVSDFLSRRFVRNGWVLQKNARRDRQTRISN